jgi:hypothetical protein
MVAGIWGQTRNSGDRTIDPPELPKRRPGGRGRPWRPDVGTDTKFQIWGQARCPMCRSGTFNVKRSTLNFQRGDRKGAWSPGYGDRHDVWAPGFLTRTSPSACQPVETDWGSPPPPKKGTDTEFHHVRATGLLTRRTYPSAGRAVEVGLGRRDMGTDTKFQIWGQTRCPIYRSGTFNVKRSTLNVQWW